MTDQSAEITELRAKLAAAEIELNYQRSEAQAARDDEMRQARMVAALTADLADAEVAIEYATANARMFSAISLAKFLHDQQLQDEHLCSHPERYTRDAQAYRRAARRALTEAWHALEYAICANTVRAAAKAQG